MIYSVYSSQKNIEHSEKNVCIATFCNEEFAKGAYALGYSIKEHHSPQLRMICLVPMNMNVSYVNMLSTFWEIRYINVFKQHSSSRVSWGKISIWNLTEFSKVLYLDSDTIVIRPVDELFKFKELSCAPDPNIVQFCNTGVMIIEPNQQKLADIMYFAKNTKELMNIGDQVYINKFFGQYNVIHPKYNTLVMGYEDPNSYILHYVGKKPWEMEKTKSIWWQKWEEACYVNLCI